MQIDLRVMELLASKICHDLVSPVSAINNGVELIEDIGDSVVLEAMKLISDSGHNASRKLRLFRVAYGRAGSDERMAVKDVKSIAEQYLSGGKTSLHWPDDQPVESLAEHKGFLKVMINTIMLAEETLAYGGAITLSQVTENGLNGCRFEISGRNAQLSEAFQAALDASVAVNDLTPRTIQAYMTGRLAEHFEIKLTHDQPAPDRLHISLYEIASDIKA